MNRRNLIKTTGLVAGALLVPEIAEASIKYDYNYVCLKIKETEGGFCYKLIKFCDLYKTDNMTTIIAYSFETYPGGHVSKFIPLEKSNPGNCIKFFKLNRPGMYKCLHFQQNGNCSVNYLIS